MQDVVLSEWQVRAAGLRDLDALLRLAGMTGGGFTNLPDSPAELSRSHAF